MPSIFFPQGVQHLNWFVSTKLLGHRIHCCLGKQTRKYMVISPANRESDTSVRVNGGNPFAEGIPHLVVEMGKLLLRLDEQCVAAEWSQPRVDIDDYQALNLRKVFCDVVLESGSGL